MAKNSVINNYSGYVDNNNFTSYYYDISLISIDMNDSSNINNLSSYLNAMRIYFDYVNNVFPIVEVNLRLNKELYTYIRDNNIKFVIKMVKKTKSLLDDKVTNLKDSNTIINSETFSIMNKKAILYSNSDLSEDNPNLKINFVLFMDRHLQANKIIINGNYLDSRLTDVLGFLNKIPNTDVLIERPENIQKFKQIIIPPLNIPRFCKYLQNFYVPYKDGIKIFFGFNETIVMNSSISNITPHLDNEYINVFFDTVEDNELNAIYPYDCGYTNNNGKYYYIKTKDDNIRISIKERTKEEIYGTLNRVIIKDENLNIEYYDTEDDIREVDKTQIHFDNMTNPFPKNKYEKDNFEPVCMFTFYGLDIDTFKPNKLFLLPFLNEIYEMKISRTNLVFSKDFNTGYFSAKGITLLEEN